jgi:hypothetical protein
MKKILFLIGLTFLCSCSWQYRFRVYNKTEKVLRVRYKFHLLDAKQRVYQSPVFFEKVKVVDKKEEKIDSHIQYQFHKDSNTVSFLLKKDQIATIGWGRNTHYKWLMALKEDMANGRDSLPPWISEFNLDELWITSPDSQIYIREYMIDSLLKGKKSAESRLVIQ